MQKQQKQTTTWSKRENKKRFFFGQPVESFSNNVSVDRRIKEACSIGGGEILPQFQRLFLELPRDDDKLQIADFEGQESNRNKEEEDRTPTYRERTSLLLVSSRCSAAADWLLTVCLQAAV